MLSRTEGNLAVEHSSAVEEEQEEEEVVVEEREDWWIKFARRESLRIVACDRVVHVADV